MVTTGRVLLFVYNTDRGLFNLMAGYVRRILSPKACSCNLRSITYDNLGMKREWKDFLRGLEIDSEFLHRNEFKKRFGSVKCKFPAIFIREDAKLDPIIGAREINGCRSVQELITLVRLSLKDAHKSWISR
jgi:hypothetical protein